MAEPEDRDLSDASVPVQVTTPEENEALYGLSDDEVAEIEEVLESGYIDAVVAKLGELGPADGAELLSKIGAEHRERLLAEHAAALDPEVFTELDDDLRRDCLEKMSPAQVAAILSGLESDDALGLIEDLEPEFRQDIIHKLSARLKLTLEEGLSFPEESAGRLMQRSFVAIPQFWTVGKTIDYMRAAGDDLPEEFFDLFVISPDYNVVGEIPLSRLLRSRRAVKMEDLALEDIHPIPAVMDQEEVAQIFKRENLTSAPVVDDEGRLIGVITIDDVVDVIEEETGEDLLKLGGVGEDDMYRAILSTTRARFSWLFVNLLTAILASVVISFFDATIEQVVALAVLMPIVASMGGNAGTQTLTVAVRALATRQLSGSNALRVIGKETLVGALNGAGFAIITGIVTALWFGSPVLGTIIATAMIINLVCAGFFGALIPVVLQKVGADPAVASSVFLTTVTDVVGFFAFLGLAALFLV